MHTRLKSAILLVPLSVFLLNVLRIGQYISSVLGRGNLWSSAVPKSTPGHYQCDHSYTVEILSIDPLMVYINNFLTDFEVDHLLEWSNDQFETALILNEDSKLVPDTKTTSLAATLPRYDIIGTCLTERMKQLLGNVQHIDTEPIRVVKYEGGDSIRVHVDWSPHIRNKTWNPQMPNRPNNRLGSIFAYLEDDCTGGETYFPEVKGVSENADGNKFTRTDTGLGLLVRPRKGNAVFWNNLHPNGSGDIRTAHAGLPVTSGTKIGVNIWSHYFLDSPIIG